MNVIAALNTPTAMYQALLSHDPRFDGRLYVGVKTTGIYCRSICGVRVPKFENCTFYSHAAQAEKAGYRPCLVCRPELAPGDASHRVKVDAVAKLAAQTLRRIEDGALNELSVDELASEFGITARHLRNTMMSEFGITPVELAQTQRLLQAKQLLTETELSITDLAYASGFESLRRFNSLFKSRYNLTPSSLRKSSRQGSKHKGPLATQSTLPIRVDYRPPLNWPTLLAFLGQRAIPGVEAVSENTYLRTVDIEGRQGWLSIAPILGGGKRSQNALQLTLSDNLHPVCMQIVARVKSVFDLRANSQEIDQQLAKDKLLKQVIAKHSGMRLPGAFSGFELLLRAILGQQISVKGARTLAGRFADAFGDPIDTPSELLFATSPSAERLAQAKVTQIQKMGMPKKRAETVRLAARAVVSGEINLSPGADPETVSERLIAIPGIGQWTADYVCMRALAWPDAFPVGDLGIKKAMNLTRAKDMLTRSESWRPWRAYAAIYLWLSLSD